MTDPAPLYLAKFACLDCPRVFKRPAGHTGSRAVPRPVEVRRCPACAGDAYLMSADFRAPRRHDRRAWEVVGALVRAGLPYFAIWETLPLSVLGHPKHRSRSVHKGVTSISRRIHHYPRTLAEAQTFIARHRDKAMPIIRAED